VFEITPARLRGGFHARIMHGTKDVRAAKNNRAKHADDERSLRSESSRSSTHRPSDAHGDALLTTLHLSLPLNRSANSVSPR
jgi:hypothetical protein